MPDRDATFQAFGYEHHLKRVVSGCWSAASEALIKHVRNKAGPERSRKAERTDEVQVGVHEQRCPVLANVLSPAIQTPTHVGRKERARKVRHCAEQDRRARDERLED